MQRRGRGGQHHGANQYGEAGGATHGAPENRAEVEVGRRDEARRRRPVRQGLPTAHGRRRRQKGRDLPVVTRAVRLRRVHDRCGQGGRRHRGGVAGRGRGGGAHGLARGAHNRGGGHRGHVRGARGAAALQEARERRRGFVAGFHRRRDLAAGDHALPINLVQLKQRSHATLAHRNGHHLLSDADHRQPSLRAQRNALHDFHHHPRLGGQ